MPFNQVQKSLNFREKSVQFSQYWFDKACCEDIVKGWTNDGAEHRDDDDLLHVYLPLEFTWKLNWMSRFTPEKNII